MECRVVEDIKDFQDIAGEWDEALIQSGENNPFLLSDFITSWWKYYSKNRKLRVFVIYDKEKITAGIPLYLERRNLRRTITHIGGPDANVTQFFAKNSGINLIEYLISSLEKREDWDILILDRVLSTNPLIKLIENSKSLGSDKFIYYIFDAGFNGIIDLTKGYNEVFQNISQRLKRYILKGKRDIGKTGELRLHKISGPSNVRSLFKTYRELSIKAFNIRNNTSVFKSEKRYMFFDELLTKFDKKNRLDAHMLTAGDHTLGISFGYRFGKGFKWILTTFNPDFYQLRPGHLLIEALINDSINRGDPYFDMYYGGEVFYKQQWCPNMIPLNRVEICRNNFFNKSLSLARNSLKSNKVFMESARKARRLAKKYLYVV